MADFVSDIKETSEVLGKEKIDCLTDLFREAQGSPPCVEKKRYRANHVGQIKVLDNLENIDHLISTKDRFYHLRLYAIPLIKEQKAEKLLQLMCEIYLCFAVFYKERLDEGVTKDEILKAVGTQDEETLEALYYFKDNQNVWVGWGNGFPYEEGSHINISEDVLLKESFLEVLTDYYRRHFIDGGKYILDPPSKKEISSSDIKIEDKVMGRPSSKSKILEAFEHLDKKGLIDYTKKFKSHIQLIQETVLELNPHRGEDMTGIHHKTISKHLSPLFREKKKSLK